MRARKLLAAFAVCTMLFGASAFAETTSVTHKDVQGNETTYQMTTEDGGITITFADEELGGDYAEAAYAMDGKTVTFRSTTLRRVNDLMRAYWEVSKKTDGCDYNSGRLPANETADLSWTIHGTVKAGDYYSSKALKVPQLSGGYIYNDGNYIWKNIYVNAADAGATIVSDENFKDGYGYAAYAKDTVKLTGITIDGGVYEKPQAGNTLAYEDCTFTGQLRTPNGTGTLSVKNSKFTGTNVSGGYAYMMHMQLTGDSRIEFVGNTVADGKYRRMLNVECETAEITGNTIGAGTDAGRSAVQISKTSKTTVSGNTITVGNSGNAFTLYSSLLDCGKPEITISDNKIDGVGYFIYDGTEGKFTADTLALTLSGNTVSDTVNKTAGAYGDKLIVIADGGYLGGAIGKATDWETMTDAGYYEQGDEKLGVMRFSFKAPDSVGTITKAGIKYISSADGNVGAAEGVEDNISGNAFYGDINEIPKTKSGKYYAKAYIVNGEGKTVWSQLIDCAVNWTQKFTAYPGGEN